MAQPPTQHRPRRVQREGGTLNKQELKEYILLALAENEPLFASDILEKVPDVEYDLITEVLEEMEKEGLLESRDQ